MNASKSLRVLLFNIGKRNKDLAEGINVSQQQISDWKNGHRPITLNKIQAICAYADIKVSEFIKLGED